MQLIFWTSTFVDPVDQVVTDFQELSQLYFYPFIIFITNVCQAFAFLKSSQKFVIFIFWSHSFAPFLPCIYFQHYSHLCCYYTNTMLTVHVFQESNKAGMDFPNFNFNVSHHGDYVAIASEPLCLVGLDIVSCTIPLRETIPEFVQNFSSYFSSFEWDNILNAGTSDEILIEFYRYGYFMQIIIFEKPQVLTHQGCLSVISALDHS